MGETEIKRSFSWRLLRAATWFDFAFKVWDYSNALLFSNLRQAFFTKRAVYLLVFNLKELKSELSYVTQSLKSIQVFAPDAAVILIACGQSRSRTKLNKAAEVLRKLVAVEFAELSIVWQKRCPFFLMDRANIKLLQEATDKAVRESHEELIVSMRWIRCLDLLLEEDEKPFHTVQHVREIATSVGISKSKEMKAMLKLFHQLGFVIYFSFTSTLQDIVVTDPSWLTEAASKLLEPLSLPLEELASVETAGLANDFRNLCSRGLGTCATLFSLSIKVLWANYLFIINLNYLLE